MAVQCPSCGHAYEGQDFPRLMGVKAVCPECGSLVELPASTIPLTGQEAISTLAAELATVGQLPGNSRYTLVVLNGGQRGAQHPIEKPQVTIGRIECDINLNDSELSRQHALIKIHGSNATLEDLGSTNGTYVGGKRVQQATLEDRAEFRVGTHELMFLVSNQEFDAP